MKKNYIILLILISITRPCYSSISSISIPKAGSYLLATTILLILQEKFPDTDPKDFQLKTHPGTSYELSVNELRQRLNSPFLGFHLVYKPEYEKLLISERSKLFFIKRDPRDQLVSQTYHMMRSRVHGRFNFDSLLISLIGENQKSPENVLCHFQDKMLAELSDKSYISHIKRFYEGFLPWEKSPICCTVQFENLVGEKGGGTIEKQKAQIVSIAQHLGVSLTEKQINHVASKIFGNTSCFIYYTFREGKIGSWKNHFKEKHKQAFKEVAGDWLIENGWEKDNNW